MSVHEGRLLATPSPLRSSVAQIRALDRMPLAREHVVFSRLPTGSSSLVVCTPSGGGPPKMLVAGPTTAARSRALVAMLQGSLLRRLDRAKPVADAELVRHAARALDRGAGATTGILALAERLGVNERTLRQSFREHIGISPKRYARIARIRRVVRRAGTAGWADLALEHGFYDQAHLNAEFRALLRAAPRDFLAGRLPFAAPP
jgi:AraC-like DNA-binding protein